MSVWSRVSRDDLIAWANSDGPRELPELVRRLVLETGHGVEAIDMPGGTGVSLGGHDGFVCAAGGTAFVPVGASVWELSVSQQAPRKADADYVKRLDVPDGSPTQDATYVQVICRPWSTGRQWARTRTAEGRWREVRGYTVDSLVTWLEQAPATRLWFLESRGRAPVGVTTADVWWARWSTETEPALTPDLVLARQADCREALIKLLTQPGVSYVGGHIGGEEILACIVAAAVSAGDEVRTRTAVVDDLATWRRLLAEPHPLVLIPADAAFAREIDTPTPHTVIARRPHSDSGDLVLELIDQDAVASALRSAFGMQAYDLGSLARRSLVAFRRRLSSQPGLRPAWSSAPSRVIRAALLLTTWSDRNENDRAVVEALAGARYEQAREQLLVLSEGDDPLIAIIGNQWHIVSPVDAFLLMGKSLLGDDLTAFGEQVARVLGERDPALALPASDRWTANLLGAVPLYSQTLRAGIATGLALLGTFGGVVNSTTGLHGEQWARQILAPLFRAANADGTGELWASIADALPRLMEAAPLAVLDAIRSGATGDEPVLATIFQDDPNVSGLFNSRSPHTFFLWALECAAWSEDHLLMASELLAALSAIDPGGRLANRPSASLADIYFPQRPGTNASSEARWTVIDRLRTQWPDAAWSLMISMLPAQLGHRHYTNRPRYRDWTKNTGLHPEPLDTEQQIDTNLDRLIADAGGSADRWEQLLQAHQRLPTSPRRRVREALVEVDIDQIGPDGQQRLWLTIHRMVARHREYADAQWALPPDDLAELERIGMRIAPLDPTMKHTWLFADYLVNLGDPRWRDDLAAYDAEVAQRRANAIKDIIGTGGIDDAARFAEKVQAHIVGAAIATAYSDAYIDVMLEWLRLPEPRATVANNYFLRRSRTEGLEWTQRVIDTHPRLNATAKAQLFDGVDDTRSSWDAVTSLGPEVEHAYWLRFDYRGRGEFPDLLMAADSLGQVGRWAAALHMLAIYGRRKDSTDEYGMVVARTLEGLIARGEDPEIDVLSQDTFEQLFESLDHHVDAIGLERVANLQWQLFITLGFEPRTTTLHRQLARDAEFFVQVIRLAYRPRSGDDETEGSADETTNWQAENAYRLLTSWRQPPGLADDGQFNIAACQEWIDQAIQLLDAADRRATGLQHIAHIVTYMPADHRGWPSDEIAALIEYLDDDSVDVAIRSKIYNRRGVHARGMTDGGAPERKLAATYRERADRFIFTAPRVARILSDLADLYQHEATRNDTEAERARRGLEH